VTTRVERTDGKRSVAGPIERVDERDVLFARADLYRRFGDGAPQRDEYYEAHPSARELDEHIASNLHMAGGGGDFEHICTGILELPRLIARDDVVDGPPAPERVALSPEEASRLVKARAIALGADLVRTGPLRQEWTYSRVGRSFGDAEGFEPWGTPIDLSHHEHAISMGFRMDPDLNHTAPEFPTALATSAAYAIGAVVAVGLAGYIRSLGYSARAHHVYNYRLMPVPVAVDCGLGELSRAGFLMTRDFGLGLRLGTVTTDLPLEHDGPVDIGVQSFCERCGICADNCPVSAIPKGSKTEHNGTLRWKLEAESCYRYWSVVSTDCAICMTTCPWTKPDTWLHRGLTALATRAGAVAHLMVAAEKLFYGRPDPRGRGTAVGLSSVRPTRLRAHMRALGAAMVLLFLLGLWWGAGAGGPANVGSGGWGGYSLWMWWTLLGVATVWTFLAERTPRPALVALALFGAVSLALGSLWVW